MSGSTDAWMPFYVGDYLGDTQRLTTEQHGAYLLLILDYWRNGPPPDDDAVLRQISRLDEKGWKRHRPAMLRLFRIVDGEWRHKRIDQELDDAKANADRRSSKARAAAEARWGNAKSDAQASPENATGNATSIPQADANAMPQAMLGGCPPQSPSPKEEEPPNPPSPKSASGATSPRVQSIMEAGGFLVPPTDLALVAIWERELDMELERDILPIMRRIASEVRNRGGRAPFKLKLFDQAVRAKAAEDAAQIEAWRRSTERLKRMDEEQARAAQ